MRLLKLAVLVLLGGAAVALIGKRRRRSDLPDTFDAPDPDDPVQNIDEVHGFHVEELGVDAIDDADILAAQDLDALDADAPVDDTPPSASPAEPTARPSEVERARRGGGDLYGVHVPTAENRDIPDGDRSFDQGENWLEALDESATEYGAVPEQQLDIVDEDDVDPPPTDTRDVPVADRGSAGPRGL